MPSIRGQKTAGFLWETKKLTTEADFGAAKCIIVAKLEGSQRGDIFLKRA